MKLAFQDLKDLKAHKARVVVPSWGRQYDASMISNLGADVPLITMNVDVQGGPGERGQKGDPGQQGAQVNGSVP